MKKILFFLTLFTFSGNAQNLVVNPSFENTNTNCANFGGEGFRQDLDPSWDNANSNIPGDSCSSPDLFSACNPFATGMPDATSFGIGWQYSRTGTRHVGLIAYSAPFGFADNYREYIQGHTNTPLVAGQTYCVSFYVSLADGSPHAVEDLGVYFSNTHYLRDACTQGSRINVTPDLVNTCGLITDTSNWVRLQWDYVASGGEQYFVIGNFNNDANTNHGPASGTGFGNYFAYYFIDDVSIEASSCCFSEITDPSPVCATDAPFNLTATGGLGGNCSASITGTWAGPGITNASNGTFDPSVAGPGSHNVTFTMSCGYVANATIVVSPCTALDVCVETNGDFTVSNGVGPYTWQETVPPSSTPITNQTQCQACGYTWLVFQCLNGAMPVTTCNSPGGLQNFATGTTITPTANFPIQVTDNSGTTFLINSAGSLPSCNTTPCPTFTTSITSQTNVNCFGQSTGSATVSAGNGTAPYTYIWTPGNLNGATQTGLAAGNYTINITDNAGCTGSMNVNITQPSAALSANVNTTPTGCGTSTGTATVNVSGGTTNYSYVWSNSPSTTSSATGLPAGAGTVTITDALGCQLVQNFSISTPGSISVNITSQTNVNCFGQSTGAATVSASNGSAPYTYTWNPGNLNGASQTGLAAGNYTVDIVDNAGCSASINVNITQPSAALSANVNTTPGTCGANDGQATVNVSGGTTNYTYSWSNSSSTTATATGLPAGPGTVTITDALGCQLVENFVITTPGAPTLSISNITGVQCATSTNGSATVNASGGNAPLTYLWAPSGETTPTATGLHAGNNTITVTDASGCVASEVVNIPSPAPIVLSENITSTNCGSAVGEITVNATGGTGSLTYTWTPNVGSGSTISNLIGGTYDLTVEDANGCTVSETYQVDVIGTLPVIASPTSIQVDAGDTVQLFASGATNYSWSPATGLSCTDCPNPIASPTETTIYTVTGTDDFGCSGEATVAILIQMKCGEIFIPTIFSPNGDWNNDVQCVMGNCIVEMKYAIYDRWGEKVFETEDQSECWDGTFRGQELNSGVFAYKFTATLVDGSIVNQSGNLTLVR